jgi:hypothetical protein
MGLPHLSARTPARKRFEKRVDGKDGQTFMQAFWMPFHERDNDARTLTKRGARNTYTSRIK